MNARDPQKISAFVAHIGDAKPATDGLLEQLAEAVADVRDHDHPKHEDPFCMNLAYWSSERMGPVLRRLIDAETRAARYRIAWQRARTRAISMGGAADRYAARAGEMQTALQDAMEQILGLQMERDQLKAELRIGAPWTCDACGKQNSRDVCAVCETDRPNAAEQGEKNTPTGAAFTPQLDERTACLYDHILSTGGTWTTTSAHRWLTSHGGADTTRRRTRTALQHLAGLGYLIEHDRPGRVSYTPNYAKGDA